MRYWKVLCSTVLLNSGPSLVTGPLLTLISMIMVILGAHIHLLSSWQAQDLSGAMPDSNCMGMTSSYVYFHYLGFRHGDIFFSQMTIISALSCWLDHQVQRGKFIRLYAKLQCSQPSLCNFPFGFNKPAPPAKHGSTFNHQIWSHSEFISIRDRLPT